MDSPTWNQILTRMGVDKNENNDWETMAKEMLGDEIPDDSEESK